MKTCGAFVLGWLFLLGAGPGEAAEQQAAGGGRIARSGAPETPVRAAALANALDRYAVAQARRALQLNESEYEQFAPRLRSLQQARRRNTQARHRIVQELRKLAGPRADGEPDDQTLRERLAELREHDERAAQELRAAYAALDEVLTPRQQARFRLFEENIDARKLELLMRARARAGRAGS
jgi:hypothetical protein